VVARSSLAVGVSVNSVAKAEVGHTEVALRQNVRRLLFDFSDGSAPATIVRTKHISQLET